MKPERVHVADLKKTQAYVKDGLIVGGDRAVDEVVVKDIRRASNRGFERIVIDVDGSHNGDAVAVARPPYYQVNVSPDERRLIFTIWGNPKLGFNAKKVIQSFKKSRAISGLELLPRLEDDSWTFVMNLKEGRSVEVFELTKPVRIIVDVRENSARTGSTIE